MYFYEQFDKNPFMIEGVMDLLVGVVKLMLYWTEIPEYKAILSLYVRAYQVKVVDLIVWLSRFIGSGSGINIAAWLCPSADFHVPHRPRPLSGERFCHQVRVTSAHHGRRFCADQFTGAFDSLLRFDALGWFFFVVR